MKAFLQDLTCHLDGPSHSMEAESILERLPQTCVSESTGTLQAVLGQRKLRELGISRDTLHRCTLLWNNDGVVQI